MTVFFKVRGRVEEEDWEMGCGERILCMGRGVLEENRRSTWVCGHCVFESS